MSPGKKRNSLRVKIIVWSFVPTALVLASIALIGIFAYGKMIENQTLSSRREVVRLTAAQLQNQLVEFENVLVPLARTSALFSEDPKARQRVLEQSLDLLSVFDSGTLVLDGFGKVVAATPQWQAEVGEDWSKEDFFIKLFSSQKPLFSQVFPRQSSNRFVICAVPIIGERGEFAGALVGSFRLGSTSISSFYGAIAKLHISQDETVYLVDSKGLVLYHTDTDEIGKDYFAQNAVQAVAGGKSDAIQSAESGEARLVSYAPVPGTSWGLVIEQSWADLLEPGLFYWRMLLLLVLVGLILPALVVAWGVRRVTEPILLLNQATRQVTLGNLNQEIAVQSGDELEDLAQQFNHMTQSLVHSVGDLQKSNRSLQALRQCNQALVRATDENSLLHQICQIFVEVGGYRMAWIGYIDLADADKKVIPVAHAGLEDGFLAAINVTWADTERGRGSIGPAIRTRQPVTIGDLSTAPWFAYLHDLAAERGYASVISLPLLHLEELYGVIVIYASTPHAFEAPEISLLNEMAGDLAYGIASLRADAARERAQAELARYHTHLEELVKERTAALDQANRDLIEAKERAETADRIKSAFLATMSHELRTPLNSIIGFTGILLQGLAGPLNAEQNKQLGFVQTSARHLLELINDVLDISKIEAGQLKLASEEFDIKQSLEKVVQLVMPIADKKNLPVSCQILAGDGAMYGDRRRVEQVLINLLNNAIKFTESGQVTVLCHNENNKIVISVQDTGIGMTPEQIEKIFKPFSQIDTGLTRKYEGTGLGLSISKKLVEMMGGSLNVQSQPNVGSTFSVIFPRRIEAPQ